MASIYLAISLSLEGLMNKFALDYSELQSKLTAKRAYPLAEVKDKIRKVAFDVVQFIDSNHIDELWKIERDGDNEYIVAMYDEDDENKISTSQNKVAASPWQVVLDNAKENIHIFYQSAPIKKIALASLGINSEEAYLVKKYLPNKLASDSSFLDNFIKSLTSAEKQILAEENPSILSQGK